MAIIPLASTIPGIPDAVARYVLFKKAYVDAEYNKFITFIVNDMNTNMTEANNFKIMNDYHGLDLSFVSYPSRIWDTLLIICDNLKDELNTKGYYAEVQPTRVYDNLGNISYSLSYTISAAKSLLFY